jgi:Domain of unknown function (DUF4148)
MNKRFAIALSMVFLATAGVATGASAQEKSRAEVRQELVQAENDGSNFVSNASYPDVSPIFQQQVAHRQQQNVDSVGGSMTGSTASGAPVKPSRPTGRDALAACVGPVGFCTPYFGS